MAMHEYISYAEKLEDEQWITRRHYIIHRDNCRCRLCGAKSHLNVHHRYYLYNYNPWEYPDEALITLCHSCHELVHLTLPPLIYINRGGGLMRMKFTPCHRCGGYGYFKEYRHVQNGICFRCKGQRYEELISPIAQEEIFYDEDGTVFDSIEMIPNAEELFYRGKECHSENPNLAKEYYYKAAISGFGKAQNNLGMILEQEGDFSSAKRWFLYAGIQGIEQGISNFGALLQDQNDLDGLKRWMHILKNNKRFVCGFAFKNIANFLSKKGDPSIETLLSSLDILVNLASEGFEPAIEIVKKYKLIEIQKGIISELNNLTFE